MHIATCTRIQSYEQIQVPGGSNKVNLNQNTSGVKKVAAKNLKKGCAEKDVKSKWAAKASCC